MLFLILLLIDSSKIEDIRIKYSSCWDILDELKVYKSKVFVVLSKCDKVSPEKIEEITKDLEISNPVTISSKTGYGIHKLKTMIGHHIVNR